MCLKQAWCAAKCSIGHLSASHYAAAYIKDLTQTDSGGRKESMSSMQYSGLRSFQPHSTTTLMCMRRLDSCTSLVSRRGICESLDTARRAVLRPLPSTTVRNCAFHDSFTDLMAVCSVMDAKYRRDTSAGLTSIVIHVSNTVAVMSTCEGAWHTVEHE